jgi:hypothetical protein
MWRPLRLSEASRPTVGKSRSRLIERSLDGLVDEDRTGAPRKIADEQVVVATAGVAPESAPESAAHRSRTSMVKRCGLSKFTVGRIWTAFRRKPHRSETLSMDRCSSGRSATESYLDRWWISVLWVLLSIFGWIRLERMIGDFGGSVC